MINPLPMDRQLIYRGYVQLMAVMVTVGWLCSLFHGLSLAAFLFLPTLLVVGWRQGGKSGLLSASLICLLLPLFILTSCAIQGLSAPGWFSSHRLYGLLALCVVAVLFAAGCRRLLGNERRRKATSAILFQPLGNWQTGLLVAVIVIGALSSSSSMLDSLTYRLPRTLIWLQDGSIHYITAYTTRMNFLPPVWELANLALIYFTPGMDTWLWNFASWLVLYFLLFDWALAQCGDARKARFMTLLAATTTYAVLQAQSSASDMYGAVLILLAMRFIHVFEATGDRREINWVILCLGLATGVKTYYAIFGLPCLIWLFFSPRRPLRQLMSWGIVLWIPIWLACSAIPTFLMNKIHYGSLTGVEVANRIHVNPLVNFSLGTISLAWHSVQPPVDPAVVLNKLFSAWETKMDIRNIVPMFTLRVTPFSLVDNAGLGLVACGLWGWGIVLAMRTERGWWMTWPAWAMFAGLISITLALSQFVSESSARTYGGFFYPCVPLAMVGWNKFSPATLRWGVGLSLASAIVALVFNPAKPLWPAGVVQSVLLKSEHYKKYGQTMDSYLRFPERAFAGRDLMAAIENPDASILVLAGGNCPLVELFQPYPMRRRLIFLAPKTPPAAMDKLDFDYVILASNGDVEMPDYWAQVHHSAAYHFVLQHEYISRIGRGPETWQLYAHQRTTASPPPTTH